jgi:hypothetical protein
MWCVIPFYLLLFAISRFKFAPVCSPEQPLYFPQSFALLLALNTVAPDDTCHLGMSPQYQQTGSAADPLLAALS